VTKWKENKAIYISRRIQAGMLSEGSFIPHKRPYRRGREEGKDPIEREGVAKLRDYWWGECALRNITGEKGCRRLIISTPTATSSRS